MRGSVRPQTGLPLVLHIGLHKTGTSFLQHQIFPYLCRNGDRVEWSRPSVDECLRDMDGLAGLISQENLSGRINERAAAGASWQRFEDFVAAATRRKSQPKVVLVLRPHLDWLKSAYMDRLKRGCRLSFQEYAAHFSDEDLSWCKRVSTLLDNFDDVLVLNYEGLRGDPESFVDDLLTFLGMSHERGADRAQIFSARSNETPRSKFALFAARLAYSRPAKKVLQLPYRFGLSATRHAIRDSLVARANNVRFPQAFTVDTTLPDEFLRFLEEDWTKTLSLTARRQSGRDVRNRPLTERCHPGRANE